MIRLDILFVTYQSEKWIDGCMESLSKSDCDLGQIGIYVVDNASTDQTIEKLESAKEQYGKLFAAFEIVKQTHNAGFGRGNNTAAAMARAPYLLCLNIDTKLYPDTLSTLCAAIEADNNRNVAVWEMRQYPYEHPKVYDPLTGETSWVSGACFAVRREVFMQVSGFDERIFMYGEDVDLSWRIRAKGYTLRYVPQAVVEHYCYQKKNEIKPTQYIYSTVYNQLLRCKFGGAKEKLEGYLWMMLKLLRGAPFDGARKKVLAAWLKSGEAFRAGRVWHAENSREIDGKRFSFYGFQYEIMREGAFVSGGRPSGEKKVSIIVRTCGRPAVLRETLMSLRAQTYPNIEIVIVEDGPNRSEQMIREEFSDLRIIYRATGEKRGRCYNGNVAMELATGDYLNFLDDDDLFFADHVETLVWALERNPQYRIAYAQGFETPIEVHSREPYRYEVRDVKTVFHSAFDIQEILCHNIVPIQAVMFERSIFRECGGLDETLDVMEDWDMWVRFALENPFLYVPKTTSIYRVPAKKAANRVRMQEMDIALDLVKNRYKHHVRQEETVSLKQRILQSRTNSGILGFVFGRIRSAYRCMGDVRHRIMLRMGKTI